jgi:hypothetical protein
MVSGERLVANGWNKNCTETDTPRNKSHTRHNTAAFAAAFDSLAQHVAPRCCGC